MVDTNDVSLPQYRTRSVLCPDDISTAITYENAFSVRHKSRLCGMNPNYWYPVEWSENIKEGEHVETKFWSDSIALYRSDRGQLGAVENRCPHRHLPLTMGKVKGCNLVCMYHGWAFNRNGILQSVQHDKFGRELPKIQIRTYPVKERYGLIWIFPGDPSLAENVPLPIIPNAEGKGRWACTKFDFTWKSHHSMVIDNLCNLTHLYVHGKWAPYEKTWMVHHQLKGDEIELVWKHTLRRSPMSPLYKFFLLREGENSISETRSVYKYPYHVSDQGGAMAVNLMLPLSEDMTRVFTIYYWKNINIPVIPSSMSFALMQKIIVPLVRPATVEVYRQDGVTVEEEMKNLDRNFFQSTPEINPSVNLFDRLNSEQWQEWLDYQKGKGKYSTALRKSRILDGAIDY